MGAVRRTWCPPEKLDWHTRMTECRLVTIKMDPIKEPLRKQPLTDGLLDHTLIL